MPDGIIYLDGNSLGPLTHRAADRVAEVVAREWGDSLIRGWTAHDWIDLPARVGDRIARLVGAAPGSVVAADSTSVNLFKMLTAALDLRPGRDVILSDADNFPTDLYVAEGVARLRGRGCVRRVPRAAIAEAIDADVGVVMLTEVDYRTGHRVPMADITARAHAAGAVMMWDLAHSAGAFPVDLAGSRAEFAVGCGYKYLNGGPGAPAFAYVRPDLADRVQPALSGWLGHARPFAFDPDYEPAPGIDRLRVGTPPILSLAALDAALDVFDGVSLAAVWDKATALSTLFVETVEAQTPPGLLRLATPRDPAARGSQIAFHCDSGYAVMQQLIAEGVIGDFRAPDIIRFGFAPLYLRFADIETAGRLLADILRSGRWDRPENHRRAAVT